MFIITFFIGARIEWTAITSHAYILRSHICNDLKSKIRGELLFVATLRSVMSLPQFSLMVSIRSHGWRMFI